MRGFLRLLLLFVGLFPLVPVYSAQSVSANSGENRAALLELYTSEGCSSCPPTDEWLGRLQERYPADRLIPLAFHVDYWDYIGWQDPYANPRFTLRQKTHSARNGLPTIYTPQLVLSGKNLRPRFLLSPKLASINADKAPLRLQLEVAETPAGDLDVGVRVDWLEAPSGDARLYLALTEDGLRSSVEAGENAGRHLSHEHVVRYFSEPLPLAEAVTHRVPVSAEWRRDALDVVAFVEGDRGEILQAVRVDLSGLSP